MTFIWHNFIGGRVTCTCLLIIYAFIPTSLGLRQRFVLSLVLSFLLRGCIVYVNKIIPLIKSSSVNFLLHFPTHLSLALYLHTPSSCLLVIRFKATSEATSWFDFVFTLENNLFQWNHICKKGKSSSYIPYCHRNNSRRKEGTLRTAISIVFTPENNTNRVFILKDMNKLCLIVPLFLYLASTSLHLFCHVTKLLKS